MVHPWQVVGSLEEIRLDGVEAVVADVDYTLVDFGAGHRQAVAALGREYGAGLARFVDDSFALTLEAGRRLDGERWEARGRYAELLAGMAAKTPAGEEVKHWSRERWIQLASDRLGLGLRPIDVALARDLYWETVGRSAGLYPDAEIFLRRLEERRLLLVLMTASDSVLRPDQGGFSYDPHFAAAYKRRRLALLPFRADASVIGDPHYKPSAEFFDEVDVVMRAHGAAPPSRILAVGDSPKSDLAAPVARGYRGTHIKRP
jgi:FMN phosphatase YigB (HAD superfamily)